MKKLLARLRALAAHVPVRIRREAAHIAIAFAAAFVATAKPALPALLHSPDLTTARAALVSAVVAALVAGVRAASPLLSLYAAEEVARAGKQLHVNVRITDLPEFKAAIAELEHRVDIVGELQKLSKQVESRYAPRAPKK